MSDAMKVVPVIQTAPVEGVQAEPKVEPQEQDPRLEQLVRKEKALRQQARELAQQKADIETQRASIKPDDSWKGRLRTNFMDVVAEAGMTHEEITQQLMNTNSTEITVRQLQAKIAELEAKQGETLSKFEAGQKTAFEQAKAQVTREVKLLIDSDEAYETTKAAGAHDAVVELIVQTYQEDGVLLSAEEAAKQIEDHLLDEATIMAKLKKVQSRLAPPLVEGKPPIAVMKTNPQKTQTLTNAAVANSVTLSVKEKRERAIRAFKGQLD